MAHSRAPCDLVDRVRRAGIADVGLVRGVEEDDGARACARTSTQRRQRGARQHGAGRVVGRAEVDEVDRPVGQRGLEAVLGRARQVDEPGVAPVASGRARCGRPSRWCRRRPDRPGSVTATTLSSAKISWMLPLSHLLPSLTKISSAATSTPRAAVVVRGDRLEQELVALLGAVAAERLAPAPSRRRPRAAPRRSRARQRQRRRRRCRGG